MSPTPVPVLYLYLDGTVRWGLDELGRFVNGPADVRVFDGVPDRLAEYKRQGWRIVGVSNQGGIALGHVTFENVARAMLETQRQCRNQFDKIVFCQHHPDAPDPIMARCWCRKPRAGLVIDAAITLASEHNECYPPHLALFVGDRPEDEGCAAACNITFLGAASWRGR